MAPTQLPAFVDVLRWQLRLALAQRPLVVEAAAAMIGAVVVSLGGASLAERGREGAAVVLAIGAYWALSPLLSLPAAFGRVERSLHIGMSTRDLFTSYLVVGILLALPGLTGATVTLASTVPRLVGWTAALAGLLAATLMLLVTQVLGQETGSSWRTALGLLSSGLLGAVLWPELHHLPAARLGVLAGTAAVVAVVLALLVLGVLYGRHQLRAVEAEERAAVDALRPTATAPRAATREGTLLNRTAPRAGAKVVTLTTDPSCPTCREEWSAHRDELLALAERNDVAVRIQVVSRVRTDEGARCVGSYYSRLLQRIQDAAALYSEVSSGHCEQDRLSQSERDWVEVLTFAAVGFEHSVPVSSP